MCVYVDNYVDNSLIYVDNFCCICNTFTNFLKILYFHMFSHIISYYLLFTLIISFFHHIAIINYIVYTIQSQPGAVRVSMDYFFHIVLCLKLFYIHNILSRSHQKKSRNNKT
nr:MAG TPA: hypothetical protein [Caudoviricetes sp.]